MNRAQTWPTHRDKARRQRRYRAWAKRHRRWLARQEAKAPAEQQPLT